MVRWSRHTLGIGLVVGALGVWLCSTFLLAPATSFAAGVHRNGSRSCGGSSGSQALVAAPTSGASIRLNHSSGPMGVALVISGTGWPGDDAITIDGYGADSAGRVVLGQPALVRVTSRADGTFQTAPFTAPTFSTCGIGADYGYPGEFVVFLAHTANHQVSAQVRYDYVDVVLDSLDINAMGLKPGSMIPITGSTWIPHEQVTVTTSLFYEDPSNTGAVPSGELPIHLRADGRGMFTTQVLVPGDAAPPDQLMISASGYDPSYGTITASPLVFPVLPGVTPTFTANLKQGYPGAMVNLEGAHWLPGSVLAEYCRGQTSNNPLLDNWPYEITHLDCNPAVSEGLGAVPVHAGSFSLRVMIPKNAHPGPITIQVRAENAILPAIYVLAVPFTVLATWQVVHPRLAQAVHIGEVALLPLLLLAAAGAVMLRQRRRRTQAREGH